MLRVDASDSVVEFVLDRGGRLYIWFEPLGSFDVQKVSTEPPDPPVEVSPLRGGPFPIFLDRRYPRPTHLKLRLGHVPHAHVTASGIVAPGSADGGGGGDAGGGGGHAGGGGGGGGGAW